MDRFTALYYADHATMNHPGHEDGERRPVCRVWAAACVGRVA